MFGKEFSLVLGECYYMYKGISMYVVLKSFCGSCCWFWFWLMIGRGLEVFDSNGFEGLIEI